MIADDMLSFRSFTYCCHGSTRGYVRRFKRFRFRFGQFGATRAGLTLELDENAPRLIAGHPGHGAATAARQSANAPELSHKNTEDEASYRNFAPFSAFAEPLKPPKHHATDSHGAGVGLC